MSVSGSGYSERPHHATSIIVSDLSSTDPLLADETWTSSWIDAEGYDSIVVAVSTDVSGTHTVQFSPDGVNVDSTLTRHHNPEDINPPHRFTVTRKYVRVQYTNDSDDQTYFRFQSQLGTFTPLNAPLDGTLSPDFDATCVRPTDYHYEVAANRRQGASTVNKFGKNEAVRQTYETVWPLGGLYVPYVDGAAETLSIVSTSSQDVASGGNPLVAGGTGAASVQIIGIDANRKRQVEVVALNGLTPVTTTSTWLGINRMVALYSGSNKGNVGNITCTTGTSGDSFAYIQANEGVTQQLIYHFEYQSNGLTDFLWFNFNRASGGSNPVVDVRIRVFSPTTNAYYLVFEMKVDTATDTIVELDPHQPFQFSPGDVALVEAVSSANADTFVSGRFSFIELRQAAYDPNT